MKLLVIILTSAGLIAGVSLTANRANTAVAAPAFSFVTVQPGVVMALKTQYCQYGGSYLSFTEQVSEEKFETTNSDTACGIVIKGDGSCMVASSGSELPMQFPFEDHGDIDAVALAKAITTDVRQDDKAHLILVANCYGNRFDVVYAS